VSAKVSCAFGLGIGGAALFYSQLRSMPRCCRSTVAVSAVLFDDLRITGMTAEKTPLILIVDDDRVTVKVAGSILRRNGYECVGIHAASRALTMATELQPDLILLDVMMPDADGYSVCQQLKQCAATAEIPVVFLTSVEALASVMHGFAVGGVDYVFKSFRKDELLARVKVHVELKLARDLLSAKNRELQAAIDRIQTLEGLLPICSYCKKIRDDHGYWKNVDEYITRHSKVMFSHGVCDICLEEQQRLLNDEKF